MAVCPERTRLTRAYMRAATAYEAASRRVMEIGSDHNVENAIIDAEAHQLRHRALAVRRTLNDHIRIHGCDVLLADESTVAGFMTCPAPRQTILQGAAYSAPAISSSARLKCSSVQRHSYC